MITVEKIEINEIPALKIEQAALSNQPLPLVLFWHGVTSVKERNLYYGYLLAEAGIRVIMPDALEHGERRSDVSEAKRQAAFFNIVMTSVKETKDIWQFCKNQNWVADDRFAMAGTSMGAIITLSCLTTYDWITSAVSLMGTPYLVGFGRMMLSSVQEAGVDLPYTEEEIEQLFAHLELYDLSRQPDRIKDVPLLFWHGKRDPVVPHAQSRLFYDSNRQVPGAQMAYIEDKEAEHVVTQEGALVLKDWLVTHLIKNNNTEKALF